MARLTAEMKEMLGKQLCVIATASKSGIPNAGPKGSVTVMDDGLIVFSEATEGKTYRNLLENPVVSIMFIDREKSDGYQIKGKAEIVSSGALFDQMAKRQQERKKPVPKYVVKVSVDEIYSIGSGMKGKRLA